MLCKIWQIWISQWLLTSFWWASSAAQGHLSYCSSWWLSCLSWGFWATPLCSSWSAWTPGSTHRCIFCSVSSPCLMLASPWSPSPRWPQTFCKEKVPSPLGVVQLRYSSSRWWVWLRASCWPSCPMALMWLCATRCSILCSWGPRCACSWWSPPGWRVCSMPASRPPSLCTSPTVPRTPWTTSFVRFLRCSSSPVQTPPPMNWRCPPRECWSWCFPFPSLPPPMATCWGLFYVCAQRRPATRPSPPALHTSQQWDSSMAQPCSCTWSRVPTTAHTRTTWSPCSTALSPPHLTPSYTAWGTGKCGWLWSKFSAELGAGQSDNHRGSCRCDLSGPPFHPLTEVPIYGAAAKALDPRLSVCPASSHPLRSWVHVFLHGLVESNSSSPVLKRNILLVYSCPIFSTIYMNGRVTSIHGSDSKEIACNAGDSGSIPGSGRHPGEENGYTLQYSYLQASMRSLAGYSSWGHKESDTTEWLTHTHEWKTLLCKLEISLLLNW